MNKKKPHWTAVALDKFIGASAIVCVLGLAAIEIAGLLVKPEGRPEIQKAADEATIPAAQFRRQAVAPNTQLSREEAAALGGLLILGLGQSDARRTVLLTPPPQNFNLRR